MKNLFRILFTLVVCTGACADAIYDPDNPENVTFIRETQQCTNCCRACRNYNSPNEYCWWVPCLVNETESELC